MAARALVTGGSSGLGRAIVGKLQSTGYTVISLDRRPPDESGETVHIDCDLSERGSLDKTISAVLSAGPYDLVFSTPAPAPRAGSRNCRPIRLAG